MKPFNYYITKERDLKLFNQLESKHKYSHSTSIFHIVIPSLVWDMEKVELTKHIIKFLLISSVYLFHVNFLSKLERL